MKAIYRKDPDGELEYDGEAYSSQECKRIQEEEEDIHAFFDAYNI